LTFFFILADFIVLMCIVAISQRLFKRIYGYGEAPLVDRRQRSLQLAEDALRLARRYLQRS